MVGAQVEFHSDKSIQAKRFSPVAQSLDTLPFRDELVRSDFPPGDNVLGVHGPARHLRCGCSIKVQEAKVSLRLYRYHVAGADAEKVGMLEIKRKPFGYIWYPIIVTSVVQNCTGGDGGGHNAVSCKFGEIILGY